MVPKQHIPLPGNAGLPGRGGKARPAQLQHPLAGDSSVRPQSATNAPDMPLLPGLHGLCGPQLALVSSEPSARAFPIPEASLPPATPPHRIPTFQFPALASASLRCYPFPGSMKLLQEQGTQLPSSFVPSPTLAPI